MFLENGFLLPQCLFCLMQDLGSATLGVSSMAGGASRSSCPNTALICKGSFGQASNHTLACLWCACV